MRLKVSMLATIAALALPGVAQAGVLDQSQPATGPFCTIASATQSAAQTFTAGLTGDLDQVDLALFKGTTTAPLTVEIRDVVAETPGATVLGSGTLAAGGPADVGMAPFRSVSLSSPAAVVAGTPYSIVIHSSQSGSDWGWCRIGADPYLGGEAFFTLTGPPAIAHFTAFPAEDYAFRTYVDIAPGATLTVDDDLVQCPAAGYQTIQAAVNAAGPGDIVNVCRGTYPEAVSIGAGKNGVQLFSSTAAAAAVVRGGFTVDGAQGVSIQKFRIEPPAGAIGIFVIGGSSTELIRSNLVVGGGVGVFLAGGDGGTIRDNSLFGQTQHGVMAFGTTTPTTGDIMNNTVIGTPGSSGIYLFSSGGEVSGNVFGNKVSKSGQFGLIVVGPSGGPDNITLKANNVFQNGSGIAISGPAVNVENNVATQNTSSGIETASGGSTFLSNNARGNGGADCFDTTTGSGTAGTANTWTGNYGLDPNPAGICKK